MAKFCGQCGSMLEDNKCPKCDVKEVKKVENNETKTGTNALAITGFVLSLTTLLLGVLSAIPGLILSIVGLNQIKKTGEEGRGLAIAGIIISSVLLGFILIFLFVFIIALITTAAYAY